ncbi:unnamed protein product, partial [Mesorhabditis spiculigera]
MGAKGPPFRQKHLPLEGYEVHRKHKQLRDDGCFERLPYASLMATILCLVGIVLFTIMMKWGFAALFEQLQRVLKADKWNWLDKVQIFFVITAVVMGICTFFFAVAGFFSTGGTRDVLFRDPKSRRGGRCTCVFIIILCYVLLAFWLTALAFTSAIVASYHVFESLCYSMHEYTEMECLDFSVYRPLFESFSHASLKFCAGDVQQFCALSQTAYAWFWVGWAGAVLIIYGLVQFIAAHSANYSHIGNAWKYVELHECLSEAVPPPLPASLPPPPPMYSNGSSTTRSRDKYERYPEEPRSSRRAQKNPAADRDRYTSHMSASSTQMAVNHSDSVSQAHCMPKGVEAQTPDIASPTTVQHDVSAITNNLNAVVQLLGSTASPSDCTLGDSLERAAVFCAELHTLSKLVSTDLKACRTAKESIDKSADSVEQLFDKIDRVVEFVNLVILCLLFKIICAATWNAPSKMPNRKQDVVDIDLASSDDEAPAEITSKGPDITLAEDKKEELSLYEQVQLRKNKEKSKREKRQRENDRRVKKVDAEEYEIRMKKASFKVVTNKKGVDNILRKQPNFRAELLAARTQSQRRSVTTARSIASAAKKPRK